MNFCLPHDVKSKLHPDPCESLERLLPPRQSGGQDVTGFALSLTSFRPPPYRATHTLPLDCHTSLTQQSIRSSPRQSGKTTKNQLQQETPSFNPTRPASSIVGRYPVLVSRPSDQPSRSKTGPALQQSSPGCSSYQVMARSGEAADRSRADVPESPQRTLLHLAFRPPRCRPVYCCTPRRAVQLTSKRLHCGVLRLIPPAARAGFICRLCRLLGGSSTTHPGKQDEERRIRHEPGQDVLLALPFAFGITCACLLVRRGCSLG
jgi:hypothetical protein